MFRRPAIAASVLLLLLGSTGCGPAAPTGEAPVPTLVIENARIADGTGNPAYRGEVRVAAGRITAIGTDLEPRPGETVYDARGLVLAPGFIDTHSHAGDDLHEQPDALPAVSQGITTVVLGQDGGSPLPLADFFAGLRASPVAVNVASYAGHNTIRSRVLGDDYRRPASDEEVAAMAALLEEELAAGALGLSTGLEYDPGIYSQRSEVLALAQVAARAGGRYISHVRSEDRWFEEALGEIIEIGRVTGMPVQVSHIKLAMKRLWGEAPRILAVLDAARAEGIDITADIYPYEYWQSNLMVLLPERDYTDLDAIQEALDEIAPPDGIRFTRFDPDPSLVGRSLAEIAAQRGIEPAAAFMELARAAEAAGQESGDGADAIIGTSMQAADIEQLFLWPHTNVCTDGALEDLHPRARGAFTRVLGRWVREQGLLGLEEAVHKMTGLAARHMGFEDRGVIREGAIADLVLFDPDTVVDRATPEQPERLSTGIEAVWVGGVLVYEYGRSTGARPGVVITRTPD
ncbi:MAG TPA: D-aminoacylase [Woeseiaceae bacterium]|nr:D-aminoacylase [Woeseiaceae bacterium]